ncbi:MAG: methyltransferase domain-containing protein [Deltaproteobacteria bacterium]|nr:methyltransferase domain-containing protein [Deltaproteobacteria bacterium]
MVFDWDGSKYAAISDLQAEVGKTLINTVRLQPHYKILDIGCGVGNLTAELASRCNQGFVLGIDASSSMINQAKAHAAGTSNIEFLVLDAENIQFQHEFDVVFSNSVLHWVPENKKVLLDIHTALKSKGHIGLQFPLLNENHPLIYYTRLAVTALGLEEYYHAWKFPWFVTDEKDYKSMLRAVGYQDISVKKVQNDFRFRMASQVYDFFDSVGLPMYLSPLGAGQKRLFKQKLLQEIEKDDTGRGIILHFQRLFAFGSVP